MSKLREFALKYGPEALKILAEPQRRFLQGAAEAVGAKPEGEESEDASRALVDAMATKLGLRDSTATNALKAMGVAGLEVFADPLGAVNQFGKVAKAAKVAAKSEPAVKFAKTLQKWSKAKEAQDLNKAARKAQKLPVAESVKPMTEGVKRADEAESMIGWRMLKDLQKNKK
jgi:hypothetical protein